ncbi:hypothetical protein LBMAG53_37740 [Planctomycetota bacterium]|nr:hypothetical protein LBMAG53_37740 [Planctomycetota bacterium]
MGSRYDSIVTEPLPLCLGPTYCPHIDLAGSGSRRQAVVERQPIHDYLFTSLIHGRGTFTLAGTTVEVTPGSTWIAPPGLPFCIRFHTQVDLCFVHASFTGDPAWRDCTHHQVFSLTPERERFLQPDPLALWGCELPLTVPRTAAALWRREMPGLVAEWCSGSPVGTLSAQATLGRLVASLVQAVSGPRQHLAPDERIALAAIAARRRCGIGLSVDDLAALAGYHRASFTSRFSALHGEAPRAFLARLRLDEAQSRLRVGGWTVSDLAASLGYHDAETFARAYRRHFGHPPSADF